jgi:hypothetical protein
MIKQRHWPGTSKWNRIEHRLFSHITMDWRGRPLTSHEVVVNAIAATTTNTGLTVHAEVDTGTYPTGVTVSDTQLAALPITRHDWHGDWNYTLRPDQPADTVTTTGTPHRANRTDHADRAWLAQPVLTGVSTPEFDELVTRLTASRDEQREADLHRQRGGPRKVATGAGRHPVLTVTERVLATLLHHRFGLPEAVIAQLFDVTLMTVNRAIRQIEPLLEQVGMSSRQFGNACTPWQS